MKTKIKEGIYLTLWVFTGIFLGILLGGLFVWAATYLSLGLSDNLLNYIFLAITIAGALLGVCAGPVCWKMIYIDGKRGQKYVVKETKKKVKK